MYIMLRWLEALCVRCNMPCMCADCNAEHVRERCIVRCFLCGDQVHDAIWGHTDVILLRLHTTLCLLSLRTIVHFFHSSYNPFGSLPPSITAPFSYLTTSVTIANNRRTTDRHYAT